MTAPMLSVIMPAHDEERTIGHTLSTLIEGAEGRLEVLVVANGCHDSTAAIARSVHPDIRVLELARASKIAALNAGDAAATVFPRAYVDADVTVSCAALLALAETLRGNAPRVASPTLELDLGGATLPVRLYYRIWSLRTTGRDGHIGSGVYAMNRAGRGRFGAFPEVVADDRFVQGRFEITERLTSGGSVFVARPPRTMSAHLHRGARIAAGNLQLDAAGLSGTAPSSGSSLGSLAWQLLRHPGLWPALAVYCWVHVRTGVLARRKLADEPVLSWTRDETSRA